MTALATAWVKVRPDTKGFRQETEKNILGDLEKVGTKAGRTLGRSLATAFTAAVKGAGAKAGTGAGNEFAKTFKEQAAAKSANAKVGPTKAQAAEQGKAAGEAAGNALRRRLEQASKSMPALKVKLDLTTVKQQIRDLKVQLKSLSGTKIAVDLDSVVIAAQVDAIETQLNRLDGAAAHIKVTADVDEALAKLTTLVQLVDRLDGRIVNIRVKVDAGGAQRLFAQLVSGSTSASSSVGGLGASLGSLSSVAGGVAVGVAALAGGFLALAPALLATGGLLGAFVGSLFGGAAALAVFKLGLGGIGDTLKAMDAAQDEAAQSSASFASAQNAIANAADQVKSALAGQANTRASVAEAAQQAARQVADAERAVGQARAEAAQAAKDAQLRITEANERVRDAQRTLTDAERDALQVRRDLTDAQTDAKRNLEDLASAVKTNSLDQRQAVLDVAEAARERDKVLADPKASAEQKQQAQLAYERQVQQLSDLKTRGERLAKEQADANKKGVEGSDEVVAARKRIADADDKVAGARRGVSEAQAAVRAAEEAADRSRLDGQQRIADAQRSLDDARRARESQQRQGAYQLAQASQAVTSAQRALAQASTQAGTAGGSALRELNQQMGKLSPNAQKLVKTLNDLKGPFGELKKYVQDRLLDGVAGQVRGLAEKWLPALRSMLGGLAGQFNGVADGLFKAFGRADFIANVQTAVKGFGDMIARIGASLPNLFDALGRVGAAAAPVMRYLGELIGGIFDKFSKWIRSADQTGALDSFMRDAAATLKQIFDITGLVFRIVGELVKIFFPSSKKSSDGFLGGVQVMLTNVLNWLKDPENQQKIRDWVANIGDFIKKVTTVWIPAVAVWVGRISGWIDTVSGWVGSINRFAGEVGDFFTTASARIDSGWTYMRDKVFVPLRNYITVGIPGAFRAGRDAISARFGEARDRVSAVWAGLRDRVFTPLQNLASVGTPNAFRVGRDAVSARFSELRTRLGNTWATLRDGVLTPLRNTITTTVPNAFAAGRDRMAARFAEARSAVAGAWQSLRDTVFTPLRTAITTTVPNAFRDGVNALAKHWQKLIGFAKTPVDFVVRTVINSGIIGAFNKVAAVLPGVDAIQPVPWPPKGWATGGVLPGYTPGRDVHRFVSATGGALDLSGGEAVMRPEFTKAVGTGWVNQVNAAARSGGVGRVQAALSGSFATGGIIGGDGLGDLFGKAKKKAGDIITGAKNLLTDPLGAVRGVAEKLIATIPGQNQPFGKLVAAMPRRLLDGIGSAIKNALPIPGSAGTGPGNGSSPFGGSAGMMRALRERFPGLRLISGYRPGSVTLTGNKSYHSADRAVDVPPIREVAQYIHDRYGSITKELITPWQEFNLHNGKPHTYTGAVWRQHNFAGGNAHDHWAAKLGGVFPGADKRLLTGKVQLFDQGGYWPSGTLGANLSGRTEYVQPRVGSSAGGGDQFHFHKGAFEGAIMTSSTQAEDLVVTAIKSAKRKRKLP